VSRWRVIVEIGDDGQPVRIFRAAKHAFAFPPEKIREWPRKDAVSSIRHQIFVRCAGKCEYCGNPVTENGPWHKGEMHERKPRGKGGEISLDNSVFLCHTCHSSHPLAHGNRRLHFGETKE
jgi:5-methylcytosine-specific restriction endonuclease McrA